MREGRPGLPFDVGTISKEAAWISLPHSPSFRLPTGLTGWECHGHTSCLVLAGEGAVLWLEVWPLCPPSDWSSLKSECMFSLKTGGFPYSLRL